MKPCFPWVGGKGKLLWLIRKLSPAPVGRFVEVFGGSATVLMDRPLLTGGLEVYNDYNSNLTNLFFCVKERPLALTKELGFLPLNSRDEFNALYKFFSKKEFTEDYLQEELELARTHLPPPEYEAIRALMLERAELGDVLRAADYYKLIRYSYSGNTEAFAGRGCDLRRFFHLIWDCSRRMADVVVENKDFEALIKQYDRPDTFFYCDPPYFGAEGCYQVKFPTEDHRRLHTVLSKCTGFVMVSYNHCDFITELYQDFYIFHTDRPNSMSLTPGSKYQEVVMTSYAPWLHRGPQTTLFEPGEEHGKDGDYKLIHTPDYELWRKNNAEIHFDQGGARSPAPRPPAEAGGAGGDGTAGGPRADGDAGPAPGPDDGIGADPGGGRPPGDGLSASDRPCPAVRPL